MTNSRLRSAISLFAASIALGGMSFGVVTASPVQAVNGQALTSTEAIESGADAGLVALINLGPGAVIVGAISGN